jgi:hypothetical protein
MKLLKKLSIFNERKRPKQFISNDMLYDEEYQEHEKLLESKTHQTLTRDDLGSVGWNPISAMTADGWRYWLPTLGRIALEDNGKSGRGIFLWDFLIYLDFPQKNPEFLKFNEIEVQSIIDFLDSIRQYVKDNIEPGVDVELNLDPVLEQWKELRRSSTTTG